VSVLATVLRHDGMQLTDTSRTADAAAATAALDAALDAAITDATTDATTADDTADDTAADAADPTTAVADVAARLFAGSSVDVSADLDTLGIGAVLVPPGTDTARGDLAGRLDATPGLERVTATAAGTIWRSAGLGAGTAGWARIEVGGVDGEVEAALPASPDGTLDTTIDEGAATRLLVLAERSDSGWHATLDGRSLRAVESGWRQGFELGADGGHLVVEHEPATRVPWLVLAGVLLLVTVLLALPVRRRRG
jgi:hypothetical protein